YPGCPARPPATPPAPAAQQALEVLPLCDQLGLDFDLLRSPQLDAAQPVPVLRLGEQRLDPDLTLAHRPRRVVRSGASLRAMPTEYGNWETAYERYRLRCASGLCPRILVALVQGGGQVSL